MPHPSSVLRGSSPPAFPGGHSNAEPPGFAALDRRRFLTLSSTGVAALSLGSLAEPAAAEALGAAPLSVGYIVDSHDLPSFDALVWQPYLGGADPERGARATWVSPYGWPVQPAHRLPLGDLGLSGETIEVRIHGLYPEPPERSWFEAAELDVLFAAPGDLQPVLGAGAKLPYYAWSLSARSVPHPSPPVCFRLPLEEDGGLELHLRVTPGRGLVPGGRSSLRWQPRDWRFATRFTVDSERGMPRLLRGVYLLGLAPDTWREPILLPGPGEPQRPDLCSVVLTVERVVGSGD
jgi:hypothetical protein